VIRSPIKNTAGKDRRRYYRLVEGLAAGGFDREAIAALAV